MAPLSRFNRDYDLTVRVTSSRDIIIKPPMRVAFSGSKAAGGNGLNKLTVRIYNLKESNRLALVKDPEQAKRIPIIFKVGYRDTLQLLFKGTVHRGENMREGPDMITELECLDGGFDHLNSFTSKTVKGKTHAINTLLDDMPNTGRGKLTEQAPLIRPKVLVGQTTQLIDTVLNDGESWYIDDEKLYIVKADEVISSYIPVVNARTGLLTTPTREQQRVTFDTLMNPTLRIAGLCNLVSVSAPHLNGVYRIESITFDGDNYGSKWTQQVAALPAGNYRVI